MELLSAATLGQLLGSHKVASARVVELEFNPQETVVKVFFFDRPGYGDRAIWIA